MTDAEIAADEATFAAFHRLRKHNSSRRERQAAWAATMVIVERRRRAAMRMHPINPKWQWWDFNGSAPARWTYPGCRTLEREEVAHHWPLALAAFDAHCTDIPRSRFVFTEQLRLSVPMALDLRSTRGTCVWLPDMGLWRRYSTAVKSRPHRVLEAA